jgi:CubicO group peptidase (beta-lactamase class C family)
MRKRLVVAVTLATLATLAACPGPAKPTAPGPTLDPTTPPVAGPTAPTTPTAPVTPGEVMAADTPKTTVAGNPFVAPAGWSLAVRGPATILTTPEGDSHIALIDLEAKDADHAVELGWKAYGKGGWPLELRQDVPGRDGWTDTVAYAYQISPNEKRIVAAYALHANNVWTVVLLDLSQGTAEKRGGQTSLIFDRFVPKGHDRESFAGKKAHPLDAARIAELGTFVETSRALLEVPGVAVGIVQDGKVVFAGGFGVRELGKPGKVDADTMFAIASNTKAMTTLMLAKLVDEQKLTWDSAAATLLPEFKLGDAETTKQVLVKHLICACTGMPRQDLEWILEYHRVDTPAKALAQLGTMQPTSKFGELYQYSNMLAAAAGFVGGHVAYPKLELGKAYDEAMRTRVFAPLGMKATTFDTKKAKKKNFAVAHSIDVDGKQVVASTAINDGIAPVRPAGGAWSNVRDVLRYVQMELAEGALPGGKPYIARDTLLARRAPQIAIGNDTTYGMGLMVSGTYGVTVVNHGGDLIGYHSDMMWLPEHGVGAVALTNGDPGGMIRSTFQRKLLEVLFDGKPEADETIATGAKNWKTSIEVSRKQLTVPAKPEAADKLAARYTNDVLGEIAVARITSGATTFHFGEWSSPMATRDNPDGSVSFVTIAPGLVGLELVVGSAGGKRTLVLRDAQHEYVFTEA